MLRRSHSSAGWRRIVAPAEALHGEALQAARILA